MKIRLVSLILVIVACAGGAYAAGNDSTSIQVMLKDTRGKPAAGAKLWLERIDLKTSALNTVSDSQGQAMFQNVAPGTYKISAYEPKTPAAAATVVRSTADRPTAVNLSLGKMARSVNTPKKRKRYVWVAGETGTHIGGGQWVAVEDDVVGAGANAVEKSSGQVLNQPHSSQLRAYQGPSN
jgi:hypothetical protein